MCAGDGYVGIVALRTAEEKGSLMHHPHRKAAPLLTHKARSAHVMSTLNKYPYACIIVFSHRSAAAVLPSIAKQTDTEQAN